MILIEPTSLPFAYALRISPSSTSPTSSSKIIRCDSPVRATSSLCERNLRGSSAISVALAKPY